jgi:hypothetical protein
LKQADGKSAHRRQQKKRSLRPRFFGLRQIVFVRRKSVQQTKRGNISTALHTFSLGASN